MTAIIFGMRPIIADNHGSVRLAVLSFSYDGDGLMTSAANSSGTITNSYDAATGWLVSSVGADGTEVSYSRRNGGGVSAMTSAAGTIAYAYDAADRMTQVDSPAGTLNFGYCGWNGRISASTNSHGFVVQYAYDIMDRVTNIAWKTASGATLGGVAYEYDAIGRITARSLGVGTNSFDRVYAYDDLDRLASDGGIVYTYDAAGNRMTRTENGETVTYTLGVGDRLASWTGGAYTHDAAGNVTRIEREGRPTLDLTWNSQYQLVSVSTNGVFAEGYEYDALGRRVSTTTLEGTTRHVYDDGWQVIADLDANGDVIASYIWGEGIDNLLAVNVGGASYYPLTDIQGTVWGYVDSQNNVVARWQYDAWGNVVDESVSVHVLSRLRYRFQCREWSAATGLVHFRMRWYDPETGRWLSKDPIGLSGGLNLYAFCGGSPVDFYDPFGLEKKPKKGDKILKTTSGMQIPYPPDVDIEANINEAKKNYNPFWFRNQVKNKGPWDYKQRGRRYEDFGNFHYGAVGRAFGFSENTLLREAGRVQQAAGTSKPEWGDPGSRFNPWGGSGSYGDDPEDQRMIKEGVRYYDSGEYKRQ